jgi:hypothetical protein
MTCSPFSPVLSALITTSKALVLCSAHHEWSIACKRDVERGPSVDELVKDMTEQFMQLSSFQGFVRPMNRMLRLRTLARTLAKRRNTSGLVSWDGDKILIERQSFTLLDLQSMMKGLYEMTRLRLWADILLLDVNQSGCVRAGCTALPELSMEGLVSQPAELSAGFSFLKHPDNHFDAWHDWLLRRLMSEPALARRFRTGVDKEQWHDSAVHVYTKRVRKFKEALFALVHLSEGAPACGTEITSILCKNDASGVGYWGVFVEGGFVSFVTTYHKGYSFSKHVKTIHRYVSREVSELVVYFLALARPFVIDFQKMRGGVRGRSSFIWEPAPEQPMGEGSSSESDGHEGDDDAGVQSAACGSDESDTSHGGNEANEEEASHPVVSTPAAAAASPDKN